MKFFGSFLEENSRYFIFIVLSFLFINLPIVSSVSPSGATVTSSAPETAPADFAGSAKAQAGNVTELTITGFSTTQSWQGYFGNISGTIQLADANDNALYNWTDASPQGEIYASINSTITWPSIQCFNFTASGVGGVEVPGETNQFGKNLTTLESEFGISPTDVDGVNETFNLQNHDPFYTSSLQFSQDECLSTRVFGSTGQGVDQQFEEVLLYEPDSASLVFTALLEQDLSGFNGATYDFEMLVLEDGHGTDVVSTDYYFFVELE